MPDIDLDNDQMLVESNGTSYSITPASIKSGEIGDDDLMLIERGGTSYSITGATLKSQLAGGGADNTIGLIAKGPIEDGVPVVINTDATVSQVREIKYQGDGNKFSDTKRPAPDRGTKTHRVPHLLVGKSLAFFDKLYDTQNTSQYEICFAHITDNNTGNLQVDANSQVVNYGPKTLLPYIGNGNKTTDHQTRHGCIHQRTGDYIYMDPVESNMDIWKLDLNTETFSQGPSFKIEYDNPATGNTENFYNNACSVDYDRANGYIWIVKPLAATSFVARVYNYNKNLGTITLVHEQQITLTAYGTGMMGGLSLTFASDAMIVSFNSQEPNAPYRPHGLHYVLMYKHDATNPNLKIVTGAAVMPGLGNMISSSDNIIPDIRRNFIVAIYGGGAQVMTQDRLSLSYVQVSVTNVHADAVPQSYPWTNHFKYDESSGCLFLYTLVSKRNMYLYSEWNYSKIYTDMTSESGGVNGIGFPVNERYYIAQPGDPPASMKYFRGTFSVLNSGVVVNTFENDNLGMCQRIFTFDGSGRYTNLTRTNYVGISVGDYADGELVTIASVNALATTKQNNLVQDEVHFIHGNGQIKDVPQENLYVFGGTAKGSNQLSVMSV